MSANGSLHLTSAHLLLAMHLRNCLKVLCFSLTSVSLQYLKLVVSKDTVDISAALSQKLQMRIMLC